MIWKDITTYSQSENDRGGDYARIWELKAAYDAQILTVSVHRVQGEDGWFLSCDEIRVSRRPLKSKYLKVATKEALALVKAMTKGLAAAARSTTQAKWRDADA